jgi:NADPH-dependent 2,4-dienoyl-CoA reductase/sulfur reductase-like enzyme
VPDQPRSVVVVGAGLAGAQTVVALRSRGFAGRVLLVGAEDAPPYDRPPLSKEVLLGRAEDSRLDVDWSALDAELRLGAAVGSLDAARDLADAVVLATGALPRTLPGAAEAGALTLHTLEDCRALRARLRPGVRLVVVGAGWIGAEVATAARAAGAEVTVVEAGPTPVPSALPPALAAPMADWYAEGGARLVLGTAVAEIAPGAVGLADGAELGADAVLVGIGARADTGWLAGSGIGLDADGRVAADASLRTSVDGVVAAGACASWPSTRYGRRLSMEHWDHALRSPEVAAASAVGADATYDPVPYVWSEQWGRVFQHAGSPDLDGELVERRAEDGTWAAFKVDGARLLAVVAVDRHRDVAQARTLMGRRTPVDPERLADPGVPVRMAGLSG